MTLWSVGGRRSGGHGDDRDERERTLPARSFRTIFIFVFGAKIISADKTRKPVPDEFSIFFPKSIFLFGTISAGTH